MISHLQQLFPESGNQRQYPQAGLCFRGILRYLDMLAVKIAGCDRMLDGDRVILEVNRAPF